MRKWMALFVIAAVAASAAVARAAWESVDTWDMNGNGETRISDNGTDLGAQYSTNNQQAAQIPDDGTFIFSPTSTNSSQFGAKSIFSATHDLTAGMVRLAWKYDSIDLSSVDTVNAKHGFRLWNAAETQWVSLSIEDFNDKIFVYITDSSGVSLKLGRLVNGLGPDSTSRALYMELDYANSEIRISGDWQWIPTAQNGDPVFTTPYDFTAKGLMDIASIQSWYNNWSAGDRIVDDNLAMEKEVVLGGVSIVQKETYLATNIAETNTFANLSVTNGDWIVVQSAENKGSWGETNVISFGGTATTGAFIYEEASGSGPKVGLWYAPITAAGDVDVTLTLAGDTVAFASLGAYVVRSTSGDIDVLGTASAFSVTNAGPLVTYSYTNTYDFSLEASGLFIEAGSSYAGEFASDNASYIVDAIGGNKRVVGNGSFSGASSLINVWSSVTTNRQAAIIGIAFSIGGSPTQKYNAWLQDYPGVGVSTNLLDQADSDPLNNLLEYAFGGDPSDGNILGNVPVESPTSEGGTNYIQYVYFERSDAASRGLSSTLTVAADLQYPSWTTSGIEFMGSGASDIAGYNAFTNRISTSADDKRFLRLQIELAE